jgi:putative Ca2+/H+ antiporter (TMEM165/GDT1 family)
MGYEWVAAGALVFCTIFALEFVDRTNLANIALSSRSPPLQVWIGAALAFLVSTAIAVVLGTLILSFLLPEILYIKVGGGALILAYGAWSLLKVMPEELGDEKVSAGKVILGTFSLILFLEMGDGTQILTILFVASLGNALLVFFAALLGLLCMAAVGVKLGGYLRGKLAPRTVERTSSVLMIVVGLALILIYLSPYF